MKFYSFPVLLTLLLLGFLGNSTTSQVKTYSTKLKPPTFIVQWDFSYTQPLPSALGDVGELLQSTTYGVKMGVGSHITFKLPTDKKGRIRPYMTIGYDLMMNSDNANAYIPNNIMYPGHFPYQNGDTSRPVPGKSNIWLHDFSAALGFEYAFMNKTKWTPFLNIDIGMNMIFATYRQTPNSAPIQGEVSYTMNNATRFGLGVGGGVDGRVTKGFGVVFGVKYRAANLLGMESKQSDEINHFYLNDKKEASVGVTKNRVISMINLYLGAVFYIGKK